MAENNTTNETVNEAEVSENTGIVEESVTEKAEAIENVTDKKQVIPENSPAFLMRLVVTLTAICVAIAVLLAAVNAVTKDKIAENTQKAKTKSILSIFDLGTDCELYKTLEDGTEVYLVFRDGDIIGYCNFLSSVGFGGNIDMMVGIDSEYKTEGVSIVAMSETPGVGSKTNTPEFLGQFIGAVHSAPVDGVDAVSGATISSEAVKAGVLAAHSVELDLAAVAAEKGCKLLTPAELEALASGGSTSNDVADTGAVTDTEETAPSTDPVSPDTTDTETDPPEETDDLPFVNNPGGTKYNYNVDATSVTDRYVIEIPKEDETNTTDSTTEPETTPVTTKTPVTTQAVTTKTPVTTAPPATTKVETTQPPQTEPETTVEVTTEPAEETTPAVSVAEELSVQTES